eukprot:CAMPEP_0195057606 /NCGR_PEP_ID=MMETSP0448-20130528/5692_1 /TAXON_ID=66468 /ORGANISM="Heterocapsa triquestra, Strain CCMP 448" /LENGTH=53 /DNA_ID=CAMNT_0040087627 /DNA_START=63 /DNA_END=220 /DNA_ORIENTATION=+
MAMKGAAIVALLASVSADAAPKVSELQHDVEDLQRELAELRGMVNSENSERRL